MSRCPACEKAARSERATQRAAGEIEGTPDRNGRVMHFSPEERQRRSDRAKELHAQGRFGGPTIGSNGGRAVGRHRIVDTVLEYFRQPEKQELVSKAIESNLKGKNKPARLAAVRELRQMEEQQESRMARDRGGAVDPAEMPYEDLQELVAQGLEAMMANGLIPADIELGEDDVQDVT
jgi:hypothetical protein